MIFGLPECDDEQLGASVGEVFEVLSEKPRVDVCRVGKKISDGAIRPI